VEIRLRILGKGDFDHPHKPSCGRTIRLKTESIWGSPQTNEVTLITEQPSGTLPVEKRKPIRKDQ